jgi:hypothetical protein
MGDNIWLQAYDPPMIRGLEKLYEPRESFGRTLFPSCIGRVLALVCGRSETFWAAFGSLSSSARSVLLEGRIFSRIKKLDLVSPRNPFLKHGRFWPVESTAYSD